MAKKETVVIEEVSSPNKEAFKKLIATYKEQNPTKYALKKEELEAKLKTL